MAIPCYGMVTTMEEASMKRSPRTHARRYALGLILAATATAASAGNGAQLASTGSSFVDMVLCTLGADAYCGPLEQVATDPWIRNKT